MSIVYERLMQSDTFLQIAIMYAFWTSVAPHVFMPMWQMVNERSNIRAQLVIWSLDDEQYCIVSAR